MTLKKFYVVSPEWEEVEVIIDGRGPIIPACDVVEVLAKNSEDARILGLKLMKEWPKIAKADNINPFAGLKAIRAENNE